MFFPMAFGAMMLDDKVCPHCEEPFEEGFLVHRACLLEKHGGVLPEGFEELIEEFELEPKGFCPKSEKNET